MLIPDITPEEHKIYHLEVSLTGCGVPGCNADLALEIHFQAEKEDIYLTSNTD